jgi:hypothetical protein
MARPRTKTATQSKNDYAKKNYDDVRLQVRKGQREQIKAYAESLGESVNGLINRLIKEAMEKDGFPLTPSEAADL